MVPEGPDDRQGPERGTSAGRGGLGREGRGGAHGLQQVDDGVEHEVDLHLAVAAALRCEEHRAHLLGAQRLAPLEVAHDPVGERVDVEDGRIAD